jgi:hypothetical protein
MYDRGCRGQTASAEASHCTIKRFAYEGANFFPIAVPLIWRKN